MAWWSDLHRWRVKRAVARRTIDESLWQGTLSLHPFLKQRSEDDLQSLRTLVSVFLDEKEFAGADGFEVTDEVAVAVATQACLPILKIGIGAYRRFVGIVMHADEVVAKRTVEDEYGLVHEFEEVIAGEAMEGGPIMLSWADAQGAAAATPGYNVVIHEFAHVIDMHGFADAARWQPVLQAEYDHFRERVVCGHKTLLDPYGAQSIEEFFAVGTETFFVLPYELHNDRPKLAQYFRHVYRQDPCAWQAPEPLRGRPAR